MIDQLDLKYFKLAHTRLKKITGSDVSLDCPHCGDTKGRLHCYQQGDMEMALVRCFRADCEVHEHRGIYKYLSSYYPHLLDGYKREKFKTNINALKEGELSLNDILGQVKLSKEDKPETPKETIERVNVVPDKPFELPKMFQDMITPLLDSMDAIEYVAKRKISQKFVKDWYFTKEKFITIADKTYFVENYIFVPLVHFGKLQGFYTRSIEEKRFSTIIFPNKTKAYFSPGYDPTGTVFVFEAIMDCISSGIENSMAMLSADLDLFIEDEINESGGKIIICPDNDKAGVAIGKKYLKKGYSCFVWPEHLQHYKDVNEALIDGWKTLSTAIMSNTFKGIEAEVRLNLMLV